MNVRLIREFLILAISQVAIFALSFVFYHKFSLLSYINISFYISGSLLFISLLLYTIHSGFFDVISRSFNMAFSRGKSRKWDEIPGLSELITFNQKPLLFYGVIIGIFMLIALFAYYR